MAFNILIEKVAETESEAIFRFFDTAFPQEAGELRLDKASGETTMTKKSRDSFYQRAAQKVLVAHNAGPLPESLTWAS